MTQKILIGSALFVAALASALWRPPMAVAPGQLGQPGDQTKPLAGSASQSPEPAANTASRQLPTLAAESTTETLEADHVVTSDGRRFPLRTYKPLLSPNDVNGSDWWVGNISLGSAWDTPNGNHQTTLAIIDTGFALQHEDFANRWHVNSGESGAATSEAASALNCQDRDLSLNKSCNLIDDNFDGIVDNESGTATYQNPSRLNCTDRGQSLDKSCNRIDDDGNGYVDDATGWDFSHFDNSPRAGELNPSGDGTRHGTYVAGVAAATGNNGKGLAGVDWQTKILPIQALDDDSYGNTLSVARAIRYAANQNADVISLSLGSADPDELVREAVLYAIARGIIVVAAAGNDGCDCIVYPANYPEVIAVGALSSSNQAASFSSWGANLDIMAPGYNLRTTSWTAANPTSAYATGIGGTSLATPIVSGLLTRLISQQPSLSANQAIALVTETTNKLTIPPAQSHSGSLGFGGLNASAATTRLQTPKTDAQLLAFSPVSPGSRLGAEPGQSISVYQCSADRSTTPIFRLTSGSTSFFSLSRAERQVATAAGYSQSLFATACVTLPHDQPQVIRNLNIHQEFYNLQVKD